jgi:hypothetical protein
MKKSQRWGLFMGPLVRELALYKKLINGHLLFNGYTKYT